MTTSSARASYGDPPRDTNAGEPAFRTALLSIGQVSRLTGVPVETLRTWERRYGFPHPNRSAGGHRLYAAVTVERLRWVAQAIAEGHRPSQVVGLDLEALQELVTGPLPSPRRESPQPAARLRTATPPGGYASPDATIAGWIEAIRRMDVTTLDHGFRAELGRLGTMQFLTDRVAPLLQEVGHAWADGRLTVSHEHFASERLRDFLVEIWRPLAEHNAGRALLLVTLSGEHHQLGLHMAACVAAMAGMRVIYLGMSVPTHDVVLAAVQNDALAVLLSVSSAADPATVRNQLRDLRAALPPELRLVVGGDGAPADVNGVDRFDAFAPFADWLATAS